METKEIQKIVMDNIDSFKRMLKTSKNSVYFSLESIDLISPDLGDILLQKPEETLEELRSILIDNMIIPQDTVLRISSTEEFTKISHIRHDLIGKLIMLRGIIRTISTVKYIPKTITFECQSCGHTVQMRLKLDPDQPIPSPKICINCGKKSRMKIVNRELIDSQKMTLEEDTEERDMSTQTSQIECLLLDDLVDPSMNSTLVPGTKIKVVGILNTKESRKDIKIKTVSLYPIINVLSVIPIEQTFSSIEITKEDTDKIIEMSKDQNLREKLMDSIAPDIFGYQDVKEAALLQLFSGDTKAAKRSDIHILLIGEPGLGKTSIGKSLMSIAPKSVYALGTASSKVGLTATVTKQDNDWVLEAGAMPLANGGLLVLDEIDKIDNEDREALHETLEQQRLTVNKANIHATLSTKVSVFAIANPKFGRFDDASPLISQVDMPPTLINRFDLIFVMKDTLDELKDGNVVDIMLNGNKNINIFPSETTRKYIAYAKRTTPELSKEANKLIKDFYLSVRVTAMKVGTPVIPISPRQLEAIYRLSLAHARLRLSPTIEAQDASEAIKLVTSFLKGVGIDPDTGNFDIDRATGSLPTSDRSKILEVRKTIKEIVAQQGFAEVKEMDILERLSGVMEEDDIKFAIEKLKYSNEIFEPKYGIYKIL
jgi:replicative DNA helicase Mcm